MLDPPSPPAPPTTSPPKKSLQLQLLQNALLTARVPLFDRKSISEGCASRLQCHVQLPIWQVRGPDGVGSVQQIRIPAGLVTIRRLHSKAVASCF